MEKKRKEKKSSLCCVYQRVSGGVLRLYSNLKLRIRWAKAILDSIRDSLIPGEYIFCVPTKIRTVKEFIVLRQVGEEN